MQKFLAVQLCAAIGCTNTSTTRSIADEIGEGSNTGPGPGSDPGPGPGPGSDAGTGPGSDPGGCTGTTCGSDDCNEFYEIGAVDAPPPAPGFAGGVITHAGETYILRIMADGTGVVVDATTGADIATIPGLAVNVNGSWVIRTAKVPSWLNGARLLVRVARCLGPISFLLLVADLANAGMEISLGGAAAQIGVRQQECADRFARVASGIACLNRQSASTTCQQAVANCPDAFFGANLLASCGNEPLMGSLVDALAAAIGRTASLGGGAGTMVPDLGGLIGTAIRQGSFAINPGLTCTLRASTANCTFTPGGVFPNPPGWDEAKAC